MTKPPADRAPPPPEPGTGGPAPAEDLVDFGREQVPRSEKARRVGAVFRSVAPRYDVMNDVMSLGLHRLMKRIAVERTGLRAGMRALDLAGGTGDLALLMAPIAGASGRVVLSDINPAMLAIGRDRCLDAGHVNVDAVLADAEALPFASGTFDCLTIAFGLRNVTDKDRALREMHRVLRPGGRLCVLEFSKVTQPLLAAGYQAFSGLWPLFGRLLANDAGSYRYLNESIRNHPPQQALKQMIEDAGFADVAFDNFVGGAAALHTGRA